MDFDISDLSQIDYVRFRTTVVSASGGGTGSRAVSVTLVVNGEQIVVPTDGNTLTVTRDLQHSTTLLISITDSSLSHTVTLEEFTVHAEQTPLRLPANGWEQTETPTTVPVRLKHYFL